MTVNRIVTTFVRKEGEQFVAEIPEFDIRVVRRQRAVALVGAVVRVPMDVVRRGYDKLS